MSAPPPPSWSTSSSAMATGYRSALSSAIDDTVVGSTIGWDGDHSDKDSGVANSSSSHQYVPPSIYDAIATRDYEGLVAAYAFAVRNTAETFRWVVPGVDEMVGGGGSSSCGNSEEDEEECDDAGDDDDDGIGGGRATTTSAGRGAGMGIGGTPMSTSSSMSSSPDLVTDFFRDEKKFDCHRDKDNKDNSSPSYPSPSSRSILRELDDLVRDIVRDIQVHQSSPTPRPDDQEEDCKPCAATTTATTTAAALDNERQQQDVHHRFEEDEEDQSHRHPHHLRRPTHPFKKTRQTHQNNPSSDPLGRRRRQHRRREKQNLIREREALLEKILWDSAARLSNSRPDPAFAVHRPDEAEDDDEDDDNENDDAQEDQDETMRDNHHSNEDQDAVAADDASSTSATPPLFDGAVANATPADPVADHTHDGVGRLLFGRGLDHRGAAAASATAGGGGRGTAQHLACAIDAPFGLAVLLALGVDPEARHTAFRRLPVHEAACADGKECLRLLLEAGAEYKEEREEEEAEAAAEAEAERAGRDQGRKEEDEEAFAGGGGIYNGGLAALRRHPRRRSSSRDDPHPNGGGGGGASRKVPKLKLSFFAGWHLGGGGIRSAENGQGGAGINDSSWIGANSGNLQTRINSSDSPSSSDRGESSPSEDEDGEEERGYSSREISGSAPPSVSFVLRQIWDAVRAFRTADQVQGQDGTNDEAKAARALLLNVGVPQRTRAALAFQCVGPEEEDDTSPPIPPRNVDGHGNTPLHWASFKNSVHSLDVLLSDPVRFGADVDARARPSGWTPLHDAAYSDAAGAVARLLEAGADVDARCRSGATPLCFAAQEDAPGAAELLLEAGADPAARCLGQQHLQQQQFHPLQFQHPNQHQQQQPRGMPQPWAAAQAHRNRIRATALAMTDALTARGVPGAFFADGNGGRIDVSAALRRGRPVPPPPDHHPQQQQRRHGVRNHNPHAPGRFSGYTPLHYCGHYNAARAARVLLAFDSRCREQGSEHHHRHSPLLTEIPDLNDKLPIHVAVARGSSETLRELLHGGARVERTATATSRSLPDHSRLEDRFASRGFATPMRRSAFEGSAAAILASTRPMSIPAAVAAAVGDDDEELPHLATPVSSPVLRAMIPVRPINSSKPWNCLSQRSIDACRSLIEDAELHWTSERHAMFGPEDRRAVVEVLRVGKRLEWVEKGIFSDLWPFVLSFCGRGWFDHEEGGGPQRDDECDSEEEVGMGQKMSAIVAREVTADTAALSSSEDDDDEDDEQEFTQFELDGTNVALL